VSRRGEAVSRRAEGQFFFARMAWRYRRYTPRASIPSHNIASTSKRETVMTVTA
jgi:hypothetical protein